MSSLLLRPLFRSCAIGALVLLYAAPFRSLSAQAGAQGTENEAIAQFLFNYPGHNDLHIYDCRYSIAACGPGPQSAANFFTNASADGSLGWASVFASTGGQTLYAFSGDASATSYWWDTFTVASATLPNGTLVPIDLSLQFSAALNNTIQDGSNFQTSEALAHFWYGGVDAWVGPSVRVGYEGTVPGQSVNVFLTATFWQPVGSSFKLGGTTLAANSYCPSCGGAPTFIDAQSQFFVDIGDGTIPGEYADVTLQTESGTNYGRAVAPEPSTFMLSLAPFVAFVGLRRRRPALGDRVC